MTERSTSGRQPMMAYFGHDAHETTVQKRIASLEAGGCRIVGFAFRRTQIERASIPFDNVPLGVTVDRNYLRRLPALAFGVAAALRRRRTLREADVFQARNVDMLLVALSTKLLSGARARLVYEVLDVQRAFTDRRPAGWVLRFAERQLLRAVDLLVVSSPDFINRYFEPVQGYRGPWHLLENKISGPQMRVAPSAFADPAEQAPKAPPWVIGWFGVLRCARSLDMLAVIADRLGPRVQIYIRGRLSREDIDERHFAGVIDARPNMVFGGPYLSPEELGELYGRVHFSWSIDYTDAGTNSDWLLPNKLYEGGFFNAVALAREGTTTGRVVSRHSLGHALREPIDESVAELLEGLEEPSYRAMRAKILAKPRSFFVDETDTREFLMRIGCLAPQPTSENRPRERHA